MERRAAVRLLGTGNVAAFVPLLALERRMRRTGGPGIIPFELAGTPERSRRIMDSWGVAGQRAARLSLLLDYPYLVTYSGLQFAGCVAAGEALGRSGPTRLAAAARAVAASQLAAGAFDAAENTTLLAILSGRNGRLPALARAFAGAKFALLAVGGLYRVLGLASRRL